MQTKNPHVKYTKIEHEKNTYISIYTQRGRKYAQYTTSEINPNNSLYFRVKLKNIIQLVHSFTK